MHRLSTWFDILILSVWLFVRTDFLRVSLFLLQHWSYLLLGALKKFVNLALSLVLNWVISSLGAWRVHWELPSRTRPRFVCDLNSWLWSTWASTWCSNLLHFPLDLSLKISTLNILILNLLFLHSVYKHPIVSIFFTSSLVVVALWSFLWNMFLKVLVQVELMRITFSLRVKEALLWLLLVFPVRLFLTAIFFPSFLLLMLLFHLVFFLDLLNLALVLFKILLMVVFVWANVWISWVFPSLIKCISCFLLLLTFEILCCLAVKVIFFRRLWLSSGWCWYEIVNLPLVASIGA